MKTFAKLVTAVSVFLAFAGIAGPASAALITSPLSISSATTIDFSQFSSGFQFTSGPVQIGNPVGQDIEWSSNTTSVIGNGGYGLASNGSWNSGRNGYTGLDRSLASMLFTFNDQLQSAVGGFINYAPGTGTPILEALGDGGIVLESYVLDVLAPISTPGGVDQGAFRGIQRASNDIRALRVSNAYTVLDDLTFANNPTAVPTPALLPGLIGMGVAAIRKRKNDRSEATEVAEI